MTAEAASSATALPGFCLERRAAGIRHRSDRRDVAILEPRCPKTAPWMSTANDVQAAAHAPTARRATTR